MDWLSKFEEAANQEGEARRSRIAQAMADRAHESARFRPVIVAVRPVLERLAAQVSERLGILLKLAVEDRTITMSTPKPAGSILKAAHPFWFALSQADGNSVRVVAVKEGETYRAGEPPDDMSFADFYGTAKTLVDVWVPLDDLMTGDLDRLVEWLVAAHRGAGGNPKLRIIEHREAETSAETSARKRITATAWTIGCGLVAVVVVINLWNCVGIVWRTFSRLH